MRYEDDQFQGSDEAMPHRPSCMYFGLPHFIICRARDSNMPSVQMVLPYCITYTLVLTA